MTAPRAPQTPGPAVSEHGARIAAGKIGCTVEEYRDREAAGDAWCVGHKDWHRAAEFEKQASRPNGLQAYCRVAREQMVGNRRYLLTPEGAVATSADAARSAPTACAQNVAAPSGHTYREVSDLRPMQAARLERMRAVLGVPVTGVMRWEAVS